MTTTTTTMTMISVFINLYVGGNEHASINQKSASEAQHHLNHRHQL